MDTLAFQHRAPGADGAGGQAAAASALDTSSSSSISPSPSSSPTNSSDGSSRESRRRTSSQTSVQIVLKSPFNLFPEIGEARNSMKLRRALNSTIYSVSIVTSSHFLSSFERERERDLNWITQPSSIHFSFLFLSRSF